MDYISGWCKSKRRLLGLTVIATGSNTGIGKETALDFYLRGARVIMACRDVDKANLVKREIETLHKFTKYKGILIVDKLDLSSLRSVREFASLMLVREPSIDILVNNAGVMMCEQGTTEDGLETHMATNHFGHALLTLLLLPNLVKSKHARIVSVASLIHIIPGAALNFEDINYKTTPYNPLLAYSHSKVANILFAKALSIKLQEHNISNVSTYCLHPGVIGTGIGRHFSNSFLAGTTWIFNNILYWFVKSPKCGAQTSIYCAVDEQCAAETGLYYSDCAVVASSKYTQDKSIIEKFWNLTMDTLKLEEDDLFSRACPT